MTATVLHVIHDITLGGAFRSVLPVSKRAAERGEFSHSIVALNPKAIDPAAAELAKDNGLVVHHWSQEPELRELVANADIVQMEWWNSPAVDLFCRAPFPPARLIGRFHVGGHVAPQRLTSRIIDFVDVGVPCSPHTYDSPAIMNLPADVRCDKIRMIYATTEIDRFKEVTPKPHRDFNVGYIGTVDFVKMHPNFVAMSAGRR